MQYLVTVVMAILLTFSNGFAEHQKVSGPKFNPSGYYDFVGKSPKGFEDIDWIDLGTAETKQNPDHSIRWVPIRPQGFIRMTAGRSYRMTQIKIDIDRRSFATETIKGVSYNFTGRFLEPGIYYNTEPKNAVLKGQLIKVRNGVKMARAKVSFYWFGGD